MHHPGFEEFRMAARAAEQVDAEVPALAQPHLDAWAAGIEANAKRHKGIT